MELFEILEISGQIIGCNRLKMALNKHFTVIADATNQKVGGSNPFRRATKTEYTFCVLCFCFMIK